jgi:mannose-6-phosphate isomerase-like protein (cupin superfamily)
MRNRRALLGALSLASLLAIGAPESPPPAPTVDALIGTQRVRIPLDALADHAPLAPDENFRVVELGRDASTSHHVVAIRNAETPHRHERHDLLVLIARGHGSMRIGDAALPVSEGSLLYVPRGAVHAFANESTSPAVSYVIYSPPFDGKDRVEAP